MTFGFDLGLDSNMLILLILATTFIAAGGYVINDYFDIKIDKINRPEKLIVGNIVPRSTAMIMHQVLTGIGMCIGLTLAYLTRSFSLAFTFIVVPGLLWFYSASYKRQFIIGNLVVSFLSALTVIIVAILELALLENKYDNLIYETPIPRHIYEWIGGFAIFAFLTTWIREIIKDLQDEAGDREMECRTMPIKWGVRNSKFFVYSLIAITLVGLYAVNEYYIPFPGNITLNYIHYGITIPFVALVYLVFTANAPDDYRMASTLAKIIMLIGVLYSFIFYFLLAKTSGISLFNLFIIK